MGKRDDALAIIQRLGLPKQQQNERSTLTLLALAGLRETEHKKGGGRCCVFR
jgi:hypothetical protein